MGTSQNSRFPFFHLNIKIFVVRDIANLIKPAILGITELKLDQSSVTNTEVKY